MADDGSAQSTSIWPLPKFHFQVEWDSEKVSFQEVSGLDIEAQPIEYRHGDSPEFSTIKMPGIKKSGNVTMKKGVFKSDNKFWAWFNEIKMNTIKRKNGYHKIIGRSRGADHDMDAEKCMADQNYKYRHEIGWERGGRRINRNFTRRSGNCKWVIVE